MEEKKKALYQLPLKLSCSRQLGLTGLENEMESTLIILAAQPSTCLSAAHWVALKEIQLCLYPAYLLVNVSL